MTAPMTIVAIAPIQARCEQVHRQHHAHDWQEGEAGLERRIVVDLLKIQTQHEDQSIERDVDQQSDERCHREQSVGEERQRQHRLRNAALLHDK